MPDPITEELTAEQIERARSEAAQAREATEPEAERTHSRRAEKAAYLEEKLEERARAEDERGA